MISFCVSRVIEYTILFVYPVVSVKRLSSMLVVHVSRNGMLPIARPICLCSNTVFFSIYRLSNGQRALFVE